MMQATQPELYMNMQQFSELKLGARQHSAHAARAAAQQFEGLFIQMMLKNMRSAAVMDDSLHSSNMDFYTDMYDKQISLMLSQQGGIGIAGLLQRQLGQISTEGQNSAAVAGNELPAYRLPVHRSGALPIPVMDYVAANPAVKTHQFNDHPTVTGGLSDAPPAALQSETVEPFYGWQQAESFVQDLWPHAEKAAETLGVSAHVLVAQSVLETGWGKHTLKKPDGSVAFNLFGIKAGSGWAGQTVTHSTLEFRQGAMQQETASFRAYDSVSDAVDDYVLFVQSRPRYAPALDHAGSDSRYVNGLQQAGYATDPAYASKISNIMQSSTFKQALAGMQTPQPPARNTLLS